MSGIKIVLGGATIQAGRAFNTCQLLNPVLNALEAAGVDTIDTAEVYGNSEELLGEAKAGDRFTFDTKAPGGFKEGTLSNEGVKMSAATSLKRLGVDKVDIYYIHAPDNSIPFQDWVPGLNEVYNSGAFSRFGISNFKAEDVQRLYDFSKEHNYVLPTVYQGNYSAVARLQETVLFPILRKLDIAFYAYSPIAGGFLTKTKQDFVEEKGRFDSSKPIGRMYRELYGKNSYLEALSEWEQLATVAGLQRAEVAYRWVAWNSHLQKKHGDAIIIGASSLQQLEDTLRWLKRGPLDDKTVLAIDDIWKKIENDAPLDNYHRGSPR